MKSFHPLLPFVLAPLVALAPSFAEDIPTILQVHAVPENGATVDAGSHSAKGFAIRVTDSNGAAVSDAAVLLRLPDSNVTGAFGDGTHAAIAYTDATGHASIGDIHWGTEGGVVPVTITATKGSAHAGTLIEETIGHLSAVKPAVPVIEARAEAKAAPVTAESTSAVQQPGKPATPATNSDAVTPLLRPASAVPSVSVVNTGNTHEKFDSGSSHLKWIILAAVIAGGAGAAFALMGKKSSSSSTSSTSAITIGAPTVSVGAP